MPTALRFVLILATLSGAILAQPAKDQVRRPKGIYIVFNIDGYIDPRQHTETVDQLHSDLIALYTTAIQNPAVSGLALQVGWRRLNADQNTPPDFSYLDDAFSASTPRDGQQRDPGR